MTHMKILAAVDRFPQDEVVLIRALEIAKRHDAVLTVVHVIDLPRRVHLPAALDTLHGQAEFAARDRISEAVQRLGGDLDDTDIRVLTGSAALSLIDIAESIAPDLIVMRAHQRGKISDRILGSTVDRVIAAGAHPVLVVKSAATAPYDKVLLATDGADNANKNLHAIAALLPDSALHVVQVVQIVPQLKEAMLRSGTDMAALKSHRDTLAQIASDELKDIAASAPRPVTTKVLRGDPAQVLSRASQTPDVDLIVAGAGRSSLLRRAFLGSVTRRLLRDADCDVLIQRPPLDRA